MSTMKDKEIAQKYLRAMGKCASKSDDDYLCTISTNHIGSNHKAQIMGGADDGKTLKEWPW